VRWSGAHFTGDIVHHANPRPQPYEEPREPTTLPGILTHLDAVYSLALALTGDTDRAADLTEDVFASVRDDLWTTLGGHSLRERLLARCVATFTHVGSARSGGSAELSQRPGDDPSELFAALTDLPWDERAAIVLVDRLGLTYAAGAAVLGTAVPEFRALLHRARSVAFAAYRAGAR
jgi:DNA-directed RNA polymerase specialized sigma24 family protein